MFFDWLRPAPRRRPACALRRRPSFEVLEDRLTPATFKVTTFADVVSPADNQLSLREAITRANHLPGPDTIILRAGVYKITLAGANEQGNATGDFDVTDSVKIQSEGARRAVIDAQRQDRAFDVLGVTPSSIRLTFEGLIIRNGSASAGGGILVGNADLVLKDCVVVGNKADHGGGISNIVVPGTGKVSLIRTVVSSNIADQDGAGMKIVGQGSPLKIVDSAIRGNRAAADGGGINAGDVTLIRSKLTGNSAARAAGGLVASTATLNRSTVSGNTAGEFGGGLSASKVRLTRSIVSGNSAGQIGGGIDASTATIIESKIIGNRAAEEGGGVLSQTINVVKSTLSGNHSGLAGGGIHFSISAALTGCTLSGNQAGGSGGGMYALGAASLTNCTISGNTANLGGGLYFAADATMLNVTIAFNGAHDGGGVVRAGGVVSLRNTIVARNHVDAGSLGPDVSGDFQSEGHNLIGDPGSTGFVHGVNGDQVGQPGKPLNPRIGRLADNGGPTKTHALLRGSPAIDKGDNADAPRKDQRGVRRPRDGDGKRGRVVDIGAFER